jgi:hypothetical protein
VLFCVLRGALRFFDIYNLTYQKKKKKGDIKTWNRTVFGNVGVLIKERVEELKALESAAEGGGLSEEERERKRILCRDLERALLQEEIS